MNYRLQTLRGIACFLVVYFHVIGTSETGLKLQSNNFYVTVSDFFIYIRMPLFTFLSGYVYGYRRFFGGFLEYLNGKIRRILIPFIVVSSVFVYIQMMVPGVNSSVDFNILTFYLYPYAHFWFLQSIFTIFILYSFFDYVTKRENVYLIYLFLVSILLFFLSDFFTDFLSFSRTLYLLPFFTLGLLVNEYKLENLSGHKVKLLSVIFFLCLFMHVIFIYKGIFINRTGMLAFILGCLGPYILLYYCFKSNFFILIGGFSYSIYLYHVFGTAFSRIVLYRLDIDSIHLHVLVGLFLGVFVPILFHIVVRKNKVLSLLFLGIKHIKSKKR